MQTRKLTIALGALIAGAAFGPSAWAWNHTQQSQALQQNVNQQWQQMDANHDGHVSKSEFDAYWSQQFQAADTNNDGKLSKQEAQASAEKMDGGQLASQRRFDRMFRQADTDKDGSISQSEAVAYHNQMFSKADSNNDGRLTKTELHKAIEKPSQSLASL